MLQKGNREFTLQSWWDRSLTSVSVTSLASGNALVLAFGDASCLLLQKVEMGMTEPPAPP